MSDLYRDFIDQKADQIINSLGGTITPAPPNELYRDFLDRKFDDVINAIDNVKVKSFTYTGNNGNPNTITFQDIPKLILGIQGKSGPAFTASTIIIWDVSLSCNVLLSRPSDFQTANYGATLSYDNVNKQLTIEAESSARALNTNGSTYTVYYI